MKPNGARDERHTDSQAWPLRGDAEIKGRSAAESERSEDVRSIEGLGRLRRSPVPPMGSRSGIPNPLRMSEEIAQVLPYQGIELVRRAVARAAARVGWRLKLSN